QEQGRGGPRGDDLRSGVSDHHEVWLRGLVLLAVGAALGLVSAKVSRRTAAPSEATAAPGGGPTAP
ncbi:hypothetical protein ABZ726_37325, partial [Streptomyces hundungensis]|uniref:hypothetical protein n=1 Tax=Streptomyces hundungensis TaxID=1077946 RepID=UPI0033EE7970